MRGAYVLAAIAAVALVSAACSRRARPTYEYEPWVTTTSTADAPSAAGGGAAPAAPPSTTTTLPSVWRRGERR